MHHRGGDRQNIRRRLSVGKRMQGQGRIDGVARAQETQHGDLMRRESKAK